MFSILIPTWNNLAYLKLCIESIRRHSAYPHEILIHVNEGTDGTLEWVRASGLAYTHSEHNIGVCLSVNLLAAAARQEWLLYLNDDMVCCPGWDQALVAATERAGPRLAFFASRLIEPTDTGNPLVVVADWGRTPQDFRPSALAAQYQTQPRADQFGYGSQPTLIRRQWWHLVGGYSVELSPGMSSDDDLLMKLWAVGCRHFQIVDASRVYHFACRSTGRVRRNRGGRAFVLKWGITQQEFKYGYLARATLPPSASPAALLPVRTWRGVLKRVFYSFRNYPLGDLQAWDPHPSTQPVTEEAPESAV